jgi:RHS repeat-associated protein
LGASDNGNVMGVTNNRDTTRSQSFTYDPLNRIATAKTSSTTGATCWDEAFGYDPWGNLLSIGRISGYTCSNEELLGVSATTKNQISGDTYDAAGNLSNDGLGHAYTYNAENQLLTAGGVTYTYDGDGKRVQKSSGKLYWYGMGSDPLDETDATGNTNNTSFNEYVFFGGKRIARRDSSSNVFYYFADHLGTARIVANSSGSPVDDSDFYPFGGERVYLNSSPQNYKFTGKERDSESNLDNFGARYNSPQMGRFMSPDLHVPSLTNPQSLNKYSYTFNNPLRLVDPNGQFPTPFHIEVSTVALENLGFSSSNAHSFSKSVNTIVDRNYFFDDALHAMSGDNAFAVARQTLLSVAADPEFPGNGSESAVALLMGMHLVQDRIAHGELDGMISHLMRFGLGDDTSPADENAAKDATQKFLRDFRTLLVANLGEEGAQDALLKMQAAASQLSDKAIRNYVNDLSRLVNGAIQGSEQEELRGHQESQNSTDERHRECVLGNLAACN